jgi:hypothetical protein
VVLVFFCFAGAVADSVGVLCLMADEATDEAADGAADGAAGGEAIALAGAGSGGGDRMGSTGGAVSLTSFRLLLAGAGA